MAKMLNKNDTLERLCKLVYKTSTEAFDTIKYCDCFCESDRPLPPYAGTSEDVIAFIEDSVNHYLSVKKHR